MMDEFDIKSRFFQILLYISLVTGLILLFIDAVVEPDDLAAFLTDIGIIVAAILSMIILYVFKKQEIAAFLFITVIVLAITIPSFKYDGLHNPYFSVTLITIGFLASSLLHNRVLAVAHLLVVIAFISVTIHHIQHVGEMRRVHADGPLSIGIIHLLIYGVVATLAYFINRKYESSKEELFKLSRDLQERNEEIAAQNEELRQSQDTLNEMNVRLERMVQERTEKIRHQNKQLAKYSFNNAHKVRGPLARILGLFNLYTMDEKFQVEDLIEKAHNEAVNMDEVIKKISQELEDNIDISED